MPELPTKIYVNVYRPLAGSIGHAYETRELADQMAGRDRIACVEVEIPRPAKEDPQ